MTQLSRKLRVSNGRTKILLVVTSIFSCLFISTILAGQINQKKSNFEKSSSPKIILIGIDSAEWSIINKLIEQGKLPNFAMLIKSGSYGKIKAEKPLISPIEWSSIITGKPQKKHGITDAFLKYYCEYELRPITSAKRKVKTLWNILSENNKTVGIINWRESYPVEKVRGFIVSDYFFFLPQLNAEGIFKSVKKRDVAYPESVVDDAIQICKISETNKIYIGTLLTQCFLANLNLFSGLNLYKNSAEKGTQTEMYLTRVGKYLFNKYSPDFFAIYYWAIDGAQHVFGRFVEQQAKGENKEGIVKYGQVIFDVYEAYDKMIGELLRGIDENSVVIIISPIGHSPWPYSWDYYYLLNFIFEKKGWLVYRKDKPDEPDWSKTRICDYGNYLFFRITRNLLYLNLKGRDPKGVVSEQGYNSFLKELENLKQEVTALNGEPLFDRIEVLKKEEPSKKGVQSPDLIIRFSNNLNLSLRKPIIKIKDKVYVLDKKINSRITTGWHHPSGIIIISGKNIKKGIKINGATIFDICPTVLALSGLPIANDMEGKVLTDVIEERFLQDNPITYIPSYEKPGEEEARDPADISMDEYREYLNKKLKSLGYIN